MTISDVILFFYLEDKRIHFSMTTTDKSHYVDQFKPGSPNTEDGGPVTLICTTTQESPRGRLKVKPTLASLLLTTAKVCNGYWQGNHLLCLIHMVKYCQF